MMIDTSHLILLSLIQGITEFLPISSSGHLVLLPAVMNVADQGQLIDVAAHFGTLGAVVIYVRAELLSMITGFFSFGRRNQPGFQLSVMVILASLPVIVVGAFIEWVNPAFLRLALTVALANLVFAGFLYRADTAYHATRQISDMSYRDALILGVAQIFALIPGASRSGVTMTAARARGFSRPDSARFSMLMAVPVILGASLLKSRHFFDESQDISLGVAALVAGLSLITALIAITLLMRWLTKADFKIFVYYRVVLGLLLLGALGFGVI